MRSDAVPGRQGRVLVRACCAILIAAVVGALPASSKAETLFISGNHVVSTYDLATGSSIAVYSYGYAAPYGVAYDAEQDDVYFINALSSNRYLLRAPEPMSYGVETECSFGDTYSWGGLDVAPQSQVALTYGHTTGSPPASSRTGVTLRDVATNTQTILYEVGKYAYINWDWNIAHGIRDVTIDPTGEYVYFTDRIEGTISRVPVDGSTGRQIILSGLYQPNRLDILGNAIYWTQGGTAAIRKSDLTGENVTDLLLLSETPGSIAVGGGEVFWTQGSQEWATVWHANLDGSNPRLLDGAPAGEYIAFGAPVPEPSTLATLGGLLGAGLVAGWWRRRRKVG